MTTKPNNDTRPCDHDFEANLYAAGVETCVWCGAERDAPAVPVVGVDLPTLAVADAVRRAA